MIVRTEAIVLRTIKYGETSRIATLFTEEKGKLAVIAKGARRPNSRFGSTLQPMSYVQVVFHYKASRNIQTLGESTHVHVFNGIAGRLESLTYGLRMVELVYALMQEEERNPSVLELLVEVLGRLNHASTPTANLFFFFQLRLATLLGFAPHFDREETDRIPESGGVLILDTGAIRASNPGNQPCVRPVSRRALRAFAIFARASLDAILRMRMGERTLSEVDTLIERFLRYHVEEAYPFRGRRVMQQMLDHT